MDGIPPKEVSVSNHDQALPAVPLIVGLEALTNDPLVGLVMWTVGLVVSIVKVDVALLPGGLPASSACSAWAVYVPGGRVARIAESLLDAFAYGKANTATIAADSMS